MLVTEFSKKYNVPKAMVYEVSFATDTRMQSPWETDIPERELIEAVAAALEKRIAYHDEKSEKFANCLKTMKEAMSK